MPERRQETSRRRQAQSGFHLDARQTAAFDRDGYLSPLPVFDAAEAAALRRKFEAFEQRAGDAAAERRTDLHLLQKWAWDVVHDPRIVNPVTDLLGSDVLLWSLNWFIKEPHDGKFVSFHQDATYWGLEPHDVVTAWVALSDTGPETGPMRFVPGSHRVDVLPHEDTFESDNLLTRGQRVSCVDTSNAVAAPLAAGEMSLHHVRLVHGSAPNTTGDRRIGLVLRFAATHVRQTKVADTAVLVAGADRFGHFELLPEPETDFGDAELARQRDALRRMTQALYSGAPEADR